jgi:hypothetical protein
MAKHVYKGAPRHNGAAGGYFSWDGQASLFWV